MPQSCKTYTPNWLHIFYIPLDVFERICSPNDKTYLFMYSILRCIFYGFVFSLFSLDFVSGYLPLLYLYVLVLTIFLITIMIAIIVFYKESVYLYDPKNKDNNE